MKKKVISIIALIIVLVFAFTACAGGGGGASNFPKKGIKIIVPFGAGGGSDQFMRVLEQELEKDSKYNITVVNIPGAKTAVGFEEFMSQPADGYTIFNATTDSLINITQGIVSSEIDDIEALVVPQLNVDMLFINAKDERFKTFDEMVEFAKQSGTELEIAVLGVDGAEFITMTEIEKVTGIKFKLIPYSEPGERYAALAGGHVDVLFEQPGDIRAFLESGEYAPIISMSAEPITGFEDIPTSVENGIDVTNGYWRSVWVKAEVPEDVKDVLRQAIMTALDSDEYKEYAHNKFLDIREGYYDKESIANFIQSEYDIYAK